MCTKGNIIIVNLQKAQLLSENKELQLLVLEDWMIALQAAPSSFSEQYQQSLFDILKGTPKLLCGNFNR